MHAIHQWRQYLLGSRFVVRTNHDNLKYFLNQKALSNEHQKWVNKLQTFDFTIVYKKGKENMIVDALSRLPEEGKIEASANSMTIATPKWMIELAKEYKDDKISQKIRQKIREGKAERFTKEGGLILRKGKILVPKTSKLKEILVQKAPLTPVSGHSGMDKTYRRLQSLFYWKGLKINVLQCNIPKSSQNYSI